jgi:hypothetical protein
MNPPSNWNQLVSRCADSACNIANGGCTIVLSGNFVMGTYNYEISFSGKAITIWGQEKVLDAAGEGRFFSGGGAGSFLELHDAVLQNGESISKVSPGVGFHLRPSDIFCQKNYLKFSLQFPAGHMQLCFRYAMVAQMLAKRAHTIPNARDLIVWRR